MSQLEELEEFVLWLEKRHSVKLPPIALVPTAEPLCCRPDLEYIHKQIPGRHVRGMLVKSGDGKFTIRVAENSLNLLEVVAHESEHYLDFLSGRDEGTFLEKGFSPNLEKNVDARAAKTLAHFRIEKRVGPVVEKFLETTKGYERELMFQEWRESEPRERVSKPEEPRTVPAPTIKAFLRGEFERRPSPNLQKSGMLSVSKEELESAERWEQDMEKARAEMDANPRVVIKEFADSAFNNPGFKESLQRQCSDCGRTVEGLTRCLCQIGQKGFSVKDYLERKAGEQSN